MLRNYDLERFSAHEGINDSIAAALKHRDVGQDKFCLVVFDGPPQAKVMNYAANVAEHQVIAALREMADKLEGVR